MRQEYCRFRIGTSGSYFPLISSLFSLPLSLQNPSESLPKGPKLTREDSYPGSGTLFNKHKETKEMAKRINDLCGNYCISRYQIGLDIRPDLLSKTKDFQSVDLNNFDKHENYYCSLCA
nr:hypothetical protein Iba_chr12eCG8170 [Ipomoea batatas]